MKPLTELEISEAYTDLLRRETFRVLEFYDMQPTERLFEAILDNTDIEEIMADYCVIRDNRSCDPTDSEDFFKRMKALLRQTVECLSFIEILRNGIFQLLSENGIKPTEAVIQHLMDKTELIECLGREVTFANAKCQVRDPKEFNRKLKNLLLPLLL